MSNKKNNTENKEKRKEEIEEKIGERSLDRRPLARPIIQPNQSPARLTVSVRCQQVGPIGQKGRSSSSSSLLWPARHADDEGHIPAAFDDHRSSAVDLQLLVLIYSKPTGSQSEVIPA
jgi:hypothetical protein